MEATLGNYETSLRKFQDGTGARRNRLVLLLSLLVIGGFGAPIVVRRYQLERSPEQAIQAAAQKAIQQRDLLLTREAQRAHQINREALRSTSASSTPDDLRSLVSDKYIERSLLVQAGDSLIYVAGPQRFSPPKIAGEAALVVTPYESALVFHDRDGGRSADLSLLIEAVPGIPDLGGSLEGAASGATRSEWRWDSVPSLTVFDTDAAAIAFVQEHQHVRAPELGPLQRESASIAKRLETIACALLMVIWLFFAATITARCVGVGSALLALLLFRGVIDGGQISLLAVATLGVFLMGAATWWWHQIPQVPRNTSWQRIVSCAGLALLPIVAVVASRMIFPQRESQSLSLWFAAESALTLCLAAVTIVLLRSPVNKTSSPPVRWAVISISLILIVGLVDTEAWHPESGWSLVYYAPTLAALGTLLLPMTQRNRLIAAGTAAAVLAALATWGTSVERQVTWARADVARLQSGVDSASSHALDEFALTARQKHTTQLVQLYAAWSGSKLAELRVPTNLALGDGRSIWREHVALDSVAVSWQDLDSVVARVGSFPFRGQLTRAGVTYQILVVPFSPDTFATIAIGPRSRLVAPTTFGRLVGWRTTEGSGYQLAPDWSGTSFVADSFARSGRRVHARTNYGPPGGDHVVRTMIEMSRPQPFAVRAGLVMLFDIGILLAGWWGFEWLFGISPRMRRPWWRQSYRRILAGVLTAFFLVPAVLFSFWSVMRLRQDTDTQRDTDVTQALARVAEYQDVMFPPPQRPVGMKAWSIPDSLSTISLLVDAELAAYDQRRLIGTSTPILNNMGVFPAQLARDLDPVSDGSNSELLIPSLSNTPYRLGIKAVRTLPGYLLGIAIPGDDTELSSRQLDLLLFLLLASLSGGIAASWAAGRVANNLGKPIERLTQAAAAIGRRERGSGIESKEVPEEFVPVFDALSQMERDLESSERERDAATAQTAKVVAWGEMARQVAHEIKNPLTPMRLGLQHLQRLQADQRPDFSRQVNETSERLLIEIERLDRIARAFARYGSPVPEDAPLEAVELRSVLRELVELFTLTGAEPVIEIECEEGLSVRARRTELIQVVLNLLDNARHAGATRVRLIAKPLLTQEMELTVQDNGEGIAAEQLARIFEPTFSTTTSGTGLGLAIVKRLVEGWGGEVTVRSEVGVGTALLVRCTSGTSTKS